MEKRPLSKTIEETMKELQGSIDAATLHLQQGMEEYLSNTIDLPRLVRMIQKMGVANLMGIQTTPLSGMDFYKVLGLDKTASDDEVKQRYKAIMAKIHPDISGQEMTFLTTLVNTAYGMICKERGI